MLYPSYYPNMVRQCGPDLHEMAYKWQEVIFAARWRFKAIGYTHKISKYAIVEVVFLFRSRV